MATTVPTVAEAPLAGASQAPAETVLSVEGLTVSVAIAGLAVGAVANDVFVLAIGGILLGLTPLQTILIAGGVTTVFSMVGGLRGVLLTGGSAFGLAAADGVVEWLAERSIGYETASGTNRTRWSAASRSPIVNTS